MENGFPFFWNKSKGIRGGEQEGGGSERSMNSVRSLDFTEVKRQYKTYLVISTYSYTGIRDGEALMFVYLIASTGRSFLCRRLSVTIPNI